MSSNGISRETGYNSKSPEGVVSPMAPSSPVAGKTSPGLLAFYLQMGRLWNQYRWYLDWYICLGISTRFSEFFRSQLDQVLAKFRDIETSTAIRVPARFVGTSRVTISLHAWHTQLLSVLSKIHSELMDDLNSLRKKGLDSEPPFYEKLIQRDWEFVERSNIAECDCTLDDAWEAVHRINVRKKYIYGLHIDRLESLWQRHLSRNESIRRSFDLGKLVDELIHPCFNPCDWSDQVCQVWERLYYIRDHLHYCHTQEQLDQNTEEAPMDEELTILPDLPPGQEQISIHFFNNFFIEFYQHNRLNGYVAMTDEQSGRVEISNELMGNQQSQSPVNEATLLRLKQGYQAKILELIYHNNFYPEIEDLERLKNLIRRLRIPISVPDLHQLHPDLLIPEVVNLASVEIDLQSVFDLLIKRQTLLSSERIQRILIEAKALEIPLFNSHFDVIRNELVYESRAQKIEALFSRIIRVLAEGEVDSIRSEQMDWLKEQFKPNHLIIAAYECYLMCCLVGDRPLSARIAAEQYLDTIGEEKDKKSVDTITRYINRARFMIKKQFGSISYGNSALVNSSNE